MLAPSLHSGPMKEPEASVFLLWHSVFVCCFCLLVFFSLAFSSTDVFFGCFADCVFSLCVPAFTSSDAPEPTHPGAGAEK